MAAPARGRRDSFLLLHDRAGGRRVGSQHARHHRTSGRKRLGHQRTQVVHHRIRGRQAQHRHGAHLGAHRARTRRNHVSGRQRRRGHRARARPGHHGEQLRRWTLRAALQRSQGDRRSGAGRDWRGLQVRAGAPRTGPTHALHALARRGAARPRHRQGIRGAPGSFRPAARRARGRGLHAGRERDGHARRAPCDLAGRVGDRRGWTGASGVIDGKGHLLGGRVQGGGSLHADPRRDGHYQRHPGGADMARNPAVSDL